jgi:energy-coupling factor transporter ATP-binding protein EcfA2
MELGLDVARGTHEERGGETLGTFLRRLQQAGTTLPTPALERRLTRGTAVVVDGGSGCGKSSLLIELARIAALDSHSSLFLDADGKLQGERLPPELDGCARIVRCFESHSSLLSAIRSLPTLLHSLYDATGLHPLLILIDGIVEHESETLKLLFRSVSSTNAIAVAAVLNFQHISLQHSRGAHSATANRIHMRQLKHSSTSFLMSWNDEPEREAQLTLDRVHNRLIYDQG